MRLFGWNIEVTRRPLEAAEVVTPCHPQPASAASSGLRAPGQKVASQPAQIIQLEDRRVGFSVKAPPA